jgi:hypothetical protein
MQVRGQLGPWTSSAGGGRYRRPAAEGEEPAVAPGGRGEAGDGGEGGGRGEDAVGDACDRWSLYASGHELRLRAVK